jgi:uncharacterized repeat protein (TIGR03803 family)
MKQSKFQFAKSIVLGFLALGVVLPAYGKLEEGVDTMVNFNGKNGSAPQSILEDSHGNFYGTTLSGGDYGKGTVFQIEQSGKLITLVSFSGPNGSSPEAGVVLDKDGNLYGTTKTGGSDNKGTIYKITSDGKFSTVANFNGKNGTQPTSGLLLGPDGSIYGATEGGGAHNKGTVFKVAPTGVLVTIVAFDGTNGSDPGSLVHGDDGNFYGTANKGGTGHGLVYKLTPDGHMSTLLMFDGKNGSFPNSGLVKTEDGILYGTTQDGGPGGVGTAYSVTTEGKFRNVIAFNGVNGSHPDSGLTEWSNGYFYMIGLWQNMLIKSAKVQWAGANFCGTTAGGGENGFGTVFRMGDDGTLVTLVSFTGSKGTDLGNSPNSLVPGQDGNLYGTTISGGYHGLGTVFRLQLQTWLLPVNGISDGGQSGEIHLPIVSH